MFTKLIVTAVLILLMSAEFLYCEGILKANMVEKKLRSIKDFS